MASTETLRMLGIPWSPYNRKLRAVLRYRRIAHAWKRVRPSGRTVDPQTDAIAANRIDDEYYGIYVNGPSFQIGNASTTLAAWPMASFARFPATGTIETIAPPSRMGTLTSFVSTMRVNVATRALGSFRG